MRRGRSACLINPRDEAFIRGTDFPADGNPQQMHRRRDRLQHSLRWRWWSVTLAGMHGWFRDAGQLLAGDYWSTKGADGARHWEGKIRIASASRPYRLTTFADTRTATWAYHRRAFIVPSAYKSSMRSSPPAAHAISLPFGVPSDAMSRLSRDMTASALQPIRALQMRQRQPRHCRPLYPEP
jgi:hypothetical protein